MKNLEIKTLEKDGIKVAVMIDYDKGTVSLVEREGGFRNMGYRPKSYMFANRSLEYMNSWKCILKSMIAAVEYGQSELEKVQKEKSDALISLMD